MKPILGFAANPKIGFLKASLRLAFKKPIFIMRIAGKTKELRVGALRL
ncbi:hypothetical protein HCU40_01385 [Pseudanabaena biceps]|nr:hypothetical protein [Pseudanabaena biceps]